MGLGGPRWVLGTHGSRKIPMGIWDEEMDAPEERLEVVGKRRRRKMRRKRERKKGKGRRRKRKRERKKREKENENDPEAVYWFVLGGLEPAVKIFIKISPVFQLEFRGAGKGNYKEK